MTTTLTGPEDILAAVQVLQVGERIEREIGVKERDTEVDELFHASVRSLSARASGTIQAGGHSCMARPQA